MIARIVADHESSRETRRETATRLFEGVAPENQKARDALRPAIVHWATQQAGQGDPTGKRPGREVGKALTQLTWPLRQLPFAFPAPSPVLL